MAYSQHWRHQAPSMKIKGGYLKMKRFLVYFTISLIVVFLYSLSFAAGPYNQYLTGADVEAVSRAFGRV